MLAKYSFYDPHRRAVILLARSVEIKPIHFGDDRSSDNFFDIYNLNGAIVKVSLRPIGEDGIYRASISSKTERGIELAKKALERICVKRSDFLGLHLNPISSQ